MLIDKLLKIYKSTLSKTFVRMGFECRFHPTCSEYMAMSIKKYGILKGVPKGLNRIKRCNPHNFTSCIDYP